MPLSRPLHRGRGAWTDPTLNCTHQFDLAGLCVAHTRAACGGAERRQYDVEIPCGAESAARTT